MPSIRMLMAAADHLVRFELDTANGVDRGDEQTGDHACEQTHPGLAFPIPNLTSAA